MAKSTEKNKDHWDKLSIILSALIPLSIALVGGFFSYSFKHAESLNSASQIEIARINAKVEQAKLIGQFLESLTSKDESIRKIAIKAVLLALPQEGKEIVSVISQTDKSKDVKRFAEKQLAINMIGEFASRVCNLPGKYIISQDKEGNIYFTGEKLLYRYTFNLNTKKVTAEDIRDVSVKDKKDLKGCLEQVFLQLLERMVP